ncbi:MAG: fasciclin domain-containing protein [Tannerella sp.]|jgi:hypothetical protein|nr:fasciclin domain-containing protein [Tannerella sp.]
MKNIVKAINKIIFACLLPAVMLTGCNLFGLDLQESFDYDYEAGMASNEINSTVLEFLQDRSADFRLFLEGIEYAGLEEMYNESDATYIVLRNNAFTQFTAATPELSTGYFYRNQLINADGVQFRPTSLRQYPKEQVRQFLLYHIVKGAWSWPNLTFAPTWYPTYADGETAYVNLYIEKWNEAGTGVLNNIVFNNYVGHYARFITARTSNLKASSGAYVHVIENRYLEQPTLDQLR